MEAKVRSPLLSEVFDRLCARSETRVAIRDGGQDVTYGELLRWSQSVSRVLEPVVRVPGQRVALMLPNSAAFVAAFFGIARVGGVIAPLNPRYRTQELCHYLNDLEAAALLSDARFLYRVREVMPALERTPAVVDVSGHAARLVERGQSQGRALHSDASPPLLQMYTSGSTSVPKRVVRSNAQVLAELETLRRTFDLRGRDRCLGAAPFFHVNGLVRTMLAAMTAGATLYPVEEFRRREVLDLLMRERITYFGGVPPMFVVLSKTPARGDEDLSALRIVFSSSAPLYSADNRLFHERYGVWVRQVYGSTETGTISVNQSPHPEACLESVGLPLDGVHVEVVDQAGAPLSPGDEGEIVISSPFAASEYLDSPTATAESFRDGRYFSGDLGRQGREGELAITGRKTFLLNRGGFKVNPYEVEAVIRQHPKVADAVVFGIPGEHGDDIICCSVVPSASCTTEEILAHCSERIAEFKIPARVDFRDALPASPLGKTRRGNGTAGAPPTCGSAASPLTSNGVPNTRGTPDVGRITPARKHEHN